MSMKKYILWSFFLPIIFGQSYSQEWQINREYEAKNGKIYQKLNCTTKFTNEIIQLIIDYALWRHIAMLYIVDESINSGCNMKAIRRSLDCFNQNGISIAMQKKFHVDVNPNSQAKRVLVVSFIKKDMDFGNYLEQINLISNWDQYFMWLNIYADIDKSTATEKRVLDTLRFSALSLSADLVIAIATSNSTKDNQIRSLEVCRRTNPVSKALKNRHVEILLPFRQTQGKNETFNATFKGLCGPFNKLDENPFCMLQVYKIRKTNNASMVVISLGYWNYEVGTEELKSYQSVDTRINFYGFPLVFGKKQFGPAANIVADEDLIEDDNDEENMDKISECISSFLNATQQVKMYPTLGLKQVTGNWSGLLGAVVAEEVDIGLDSVIKVPERYNDMVFTQDIMLSVRNIYLKPELSHSARDIFYAPFQPHLLLCVLGTGLIFAISMAVYIISRMIKLQEHRAYVSYPSAISDALLWIIGVFSMQGTVIQPRSCSGNIIIVISLLFALITYNSYSAFITSMLSVKLVQIRNVAALLESDYDIGYTKNSQDEIFLRSMNESQLNQIYLRGYLHNNINNITDGLLKATKGNYGFFATGHVARKQFLKISGYKCKFEIMEIPVASTINSIAFPMSPKSPYRKAVSLSLIKMTEAGIHQHITSLIAPNLPQCDQQTSYQSARINDLITSFGLLGLGVLIGSTIILFECFWKKKKIIYSKFRGTYKSINQNFEFVH